ncbi:MAG: hypothetical protein LBD17_01880 [Endomicrobium sp.]|nr:hypothetical protein [Endomicrobium sp.]
MFLKENTSPAKYNRKHMLTSFLLALCLIVNISNFESFSKINNKFENTNKTKLESVIVRTIIKNIEMVIKIAAKLDKSIYVEKTNIFLNLKEENKETRTYSVCDSINDKHFIIDTFIMKQNKRSKYNFINLLVNSCLKINNRIKDEYLVTSRGEEIRKAKILNITKVALPRGNDIITIPVINNKLAWL